MLNVPWLGVIVWRKLKDHSTRHHVVPNVLVLQLGEFVVLTKRIKKMMHHHHLSSPNILPQHHPPKQANRRQQSHLSPLQTLFAILGGMILC
jgi:hypothetical protein